MGRTLMALALVGLLCGCGGGKQESTDETAEGAARLWLRAAVTQNESQVRELTVDEYDDAAMRFVEILREDGFTDENILWSAGGPKGEDLEWSAVSGPRIVTLRMHESSPNKWRVAEVSISW